ncbi:hypothetical protein J437_LFUL009772 [Ladona fulva]|uniref:Alpha-ketoglutarate-dependent dioxygenase AlkB-like domain-containing protein n=1 Tax=Ladona fulva TaxID=123851 RepID=A0A8K0P2C2_LADFU|nr:hypothetical protein J437_LFUL009772 [Ladona fulva]
MLKDSFKYYKRRCPPPSLKDVIDFSKSNLADSRVVHKGDTSARREVVGMIPSDEWRIFELKDKPGFLYVSNPFTPGGQRYWISRCLKDYTRKPNRLNLDNHVETKGCEGLWEEYVLNPEPGYQLLKKLRWATLGYHHNWDTKVYEESAHDHFPEDLASLSQEVAAALGYPNFSAEAAIINYYHMDSTLSCHTDHSDFGQSAVFLLGGKTKDEEPVAMLIKSGDVVIMSGESRLCYHGIPLIVPATSCPWDVNERENQDSSFNEDHCIKENEPQSFQSSVFKECYSAKSWEPFKEYISTARINMNVRQVLPVGQVSL